jgi:hypothetical protein
LFKKIPYDPVKDLMPVSFVSTVPTVLVVHTNVPAQNLKELVQLARSKPEAMNYGSAGNGSGNHLTTEVFLNTTGLKVQHIPYKGGGAVMADLVAGQVTFVFAVLPTALPFITSGKLRALGVSSAQRNPALPDGSLAKTATWSGRSADVYPIGVDSAWHNSDNDLLFFNSLKMKMSVILGITQMTFGLVLKVCNALYFKSRADLYLEAIPQLVFMVSLFGYMIFLIMLKWCINWNDAATAPGAATKRTGSRLSPSSAKLVASGGSPRSAASTAAGSLPHSCAISGRSSALVVKLVSR